MKRIVHMLVLLLICTISFAQKDKDSNKEKPQDTKITPGASGVKRSIGYKFSSDTGDTDPGIGIFRYNKKNVASVTYIFVDKNDIKGEDQTSWYKTWDDTTGATGRGQLVLVELRGDNVNVFDVTGVFIDGNGYWKFPVKYVSGKLPVNDSVYFYVFERIAHGRGQGNEEKVEKVEEVEVAAEEPVAEVVPEVTAAEEVVVAAEALVVEAAPAVPAAEEVVVIAEAPVVEVAPVIPAAEEVVAIAEAPVVEAAPTVPAAEEVVVIAEAPVVEAAPAVPAAEEIVVIAEAPVVEAAPAVPAAEEIVVIAEAPVVEAAPAVPAAEEVVVIAEAPAVEPAPVVPIVEPAVVVAEAPLVVEPAPVVPTAEPAVVVAEAPVAKPAPAKQGTTVAAGPPRVSETKQPSQETTTAQKPPVAQPAQVTKNEPVAQPAPATQGTTITQGTKINENPATQNFYGSSGVSHGKCYRGIIEVGYAFRVSEYGMNNFRFNFINGFNIRNTSIGLGIGVRKYYENPSRHPDWHLVSSDVQIPVFLDVRTHFSSKKITPYLGIGIGNSAGFDSDTAKSKPEGLYFHATGGMWFNISERFAVFGGFAYELQRLGYANLSDEILYKKYTNSVSINIGIAF